MSAHRHPLLWMVAPLIAWALHFVAVYALVGLHCGAPPAWRPRVPDLALHTGLLLATAAAVAAIGWIAVDGWRRRSPGATPDGAGPGAEARGQVFRATVQVLIAALALLAVAFTMLPTALLEACP